MTGPLLSSVLSAVLAAAVIWLALRVSAGVFGVESARAAAHEASARLVTLPAGSAAVVRRRFARALVSQVVVMPSGERLAFSRLRVRVSPEDAERLDPDVDLERLGADGAALYEAHAVREGWTLPTQVEVEVEVDPVLRAGWIPPARGSGRAESRRPLDLPHQPPGLGWSMLAAPRAVADQRSSRDHEAALTVTLAPGSPDRAEPGRRGVVELTAQGRTVRLDADVDEAVIGRDPRADLALPAPEVSWEHLRLRRGAGGWEISDLGSTNGTTACGVRLAPRAWVALTPGTLLVAGVAVHVVVEEADVPPPATSPRAHVPATIDLDGLTTTR